MPAQLSYYFRGQSHMRKSPIKQRFRLLLSLLFLKLYTFKTDSDHESALLARPAIADWLLLFLFHTCHQPHI